MKFFVVLAMLVAAVSAFGPSVQQSRVSSRFALFADVESTQPKEPEPTQEPPAAAVVVAPEAAAVVAPEAAAAAPAEAAVAAAAVAPAAAAAPRTAGQQFNLQPEYGKGKELPNTYVRCGTCQSHFAIKPEDLGERGKGRYVAPVVN